MKVRMTFLGGPDTGNVGEDTRGVPGTGMMKFELNKPVDIDTDAPENAANRKFLMDMIGKARGNRFYKVEDIGDHEHRAHRPDDSQGGMMPEDQRVGSTVNEGFPVPDNPGRGVKPHETNMEVTDHNVKDRGPQPPPDNRGQVKPGNNPEHLRSGSTPLKRP